jgi:hypothetical protein
VLVRPLAAAGYRGSDCSALLIASWDAARFRDGSYEMAITNEDLTYWRSIMSVLLMSMQFRVERKLKQANVGDNKSLEQIDSYNAMFCEIAAKIVGEGLRSVVLALQEQQSQDTSKSTPSTIVGHRDVALLLNILQTMSNCPALPQFAVQLGEALISTGAGDQLCCCTHSRTRCLRRERQSTRALQSPSSPQSLPSLESQRIWHLKAFSISS